MKVFNSILQFVYNIFKWLLITVFGVMTCTIVLQIVARYIFGKSFLWSDEVARYGLVFCVFIGASLVMFENDHIYVNALDTMLPKAGVRWLNVFRMFLTMAYAFIIAWLSPLAIAVGKTSVSSNMRIPMNYVYMIFPVAFWMLFIYTFFNFLKFLLNVPDDKSKEVEPK